MILYDRLNNLQNEVKAKDFILNDYSQPITKQLATAVRSAVKKHLPELKISARSDWNRLWINILKMPYKKNSRQHEAIKKSIDELINGFVIHEARPYCDYDYYSFYYFGISLNYDFIPEEMPAALKFEELQLIAIDEEEARQEEIAQQEAIKKAEEEHKRQNEENKKWEAKRAKNKKIIEAAINVYDANYILKGTRWPTLNKNNTLSIYEEELERDYSIEDAHIKKVIDFGQNESAFNTFSNMFMEDFDFLKNAEGGQYTDDPRMDISENQYNYKIVSSCKWISIAVAVVFNNDVKYLINTQGHSYARYVGFV